MSRRHEQLPFQNKELNDLAKELYDPKVGFVIIKNFIPEDDIKKIKEKYLYKNIEKKEQRLDTLKKHDPNEYYFLMEYMYKNKKSNFDPMIYKYVKNIYNLRYKISIQENADHFLLDYLQRHNLDPQDIETNIDHQLNHNYFRITRYRNGDGFHPHYDNPGEIQCIVFLSQKGIDYDKGGLYLIDEDGNELDADSSINTGDLVILNSYKRYHRVEPVKTSGDQIGRMHLFVPILPDYWFKPSYFFKEDPLKLYFSTPKTELEKDILYAEHLKKLQNNTAKALDEGKD